MKDLNHMPPSQIGAVLNSSRVLIKERWDDQVSNYKSLANTEKFLSSIFTELSSRLLGLGYDTDIDRLLGEPSEVINASFDLKAIITDVLEVNGQLTRGEFDAINAVFEERIRSSSKRQYDERFTDFLDALPVAIVLVEQESAKIVYVNKEADRVVCGYPRILPGPEFQEKFYATDSKGEKIPNERMPRNLVARGESIHNHRMTWHKLTSIF